MLHILQCTAVRDFTETQRTLIIPAGSVATDRMCFNLSSVVINDEVVEMTENFTLSLSSSSTSVSIDNATVQGSITDTDGKYHGIGLILPINSSSFYGHRNEGKIIMDSHGVRFQCYSHLFSYRGTINL